MGSTEESKEHKENRADRKEETTEKEDDTERDHKPRKENKTRKEQRSNNPLQFQFSDCSDSSVIKLIKETFCLLLTSSFPCSKNYAYISLFDIQQHETTCTLISQPLLRAQRLSVGYQSRFL